MNPHSSPTSIRVYHALVLLLALSCITGLAAPFVEHAVDNTFAGISVCGVDLDKDGDPDVLATSMFGDEVAWWENDGNQGFTKHTIDASLASATAAVAVDIDNDGDIDVVACNNDARLDWWFNPSVVVWYENLGGELFAKHVVGALGGSYAIVCTNINADASVDIVVGDGDSQRLFCYTNSGAGTFGRITIDSVIAGIHDVAAADIDGDGDIDLAAAADYPADVVVWYRNNGSGSFVRYTIDASFIGARAVAIGDIDADGTNDIVAGSSSAAADQGEVAWWRNDGNANFAKHSVASNFDCYDVTTEDVDKDGNMDVVASSFLANEVAYFAGETNRHFSKTMIDNNAQGPKGICFFDMDDDAYADLLGAASDASTILWWQIDPTIAFAPEVLVVTGDDATNQFAIFNPGPGTIHYVVAKSPDWISGVSPTNGTSTARSVTYHDVAYETSLLSAGTFRTALSISAPDAANTPQNGPVIEVIPEPAAFALCVAACAAGRWRRSRARSRV